MSTIAKVNCFGINYNQQIVVYFQSDDWSDHRMIIIMLILSGRENTRII